MWKWRCEDIAISEAGHVDGSWLRICSFASGSEISTWWGAELELYCSVLEGNLNGYGAPEMDTQFFTYLGLYKICVYMVDSECSQNHYTSVKYKTVQSFKLHCLQSSPLCNYTHLPVTVKVLATFLEAILCNPF
jgi:hypothetical protein